MVEYAGTLRSLTPGVPYLLGAIRAWVTRRTCPRVMPLNTLGVSCLGTTSCWLTRAVHPLGRVPRCTILGRVSGREQSLAQCPNFLHRLHWSAGLAGRALGPDSGQSGAQCPYFLQRWHWSPALAGRAVAD